MTERLPNYGGQAVLEGVMMRGARWAAIAVRAPDQSIIIHKEPLGAIYRSKISRIPFVRGLILLWDALGLGMRALTFSANVQTGEEEKIEGPTLYLTLSASILLAAGLFFLFPALVGQWSEHLLSILSSPQSNALSLQSVFSLRAPLQAIPNWINWSGNLIEGFTRLGMLIGYIALVGRIPDIRRVFMYHGAEHKTINAFENGAELTPESVARFSVEHPRCGTAFLLTLVLLSILIFTLLGSLPLWIRLVTRLLFIPILAGLAYEYIRWTANHLHHPFVRWLVRPNLALQRLTTRQPTLDMLEVSIAAFEAMRAEEKVNL